MSEAWSWLSANWGIIATVLFGISEALSLIPGIEANGVFELIYTILKFFAGKSGTTSLPDGGPFVSSIGPNKNSSNGVK